MVFEKFIKDDKTKSAVVHKLENIGEATKNIPKHIKALYKEDDILLIDIGTHDEIY